MRVIQTHTVRFQGLRVQSLQQDGLHKAVIRLGASLVGYLLFFFFVVLGLGGPEEHVCVVALLRKSIVASNFFSIAFTVAFPKP